MFFARLTRLNVCTYTISIKVKIVRTRNQLFNLLLADKKHTTFVTIPRFQAGIPVTLGSVLSTSTGKNIIQPFPSWKWHRDPEHCRRDRLVSVYRIKIDNCGRLWVLDTGRHLDKKVCDMQILAFDLATVSRPQC